MCLQSIDRFFSAWLEQLTKNRIKCKLHRLFMHTSMMTLVLYQMWPFLIDVKNDAKLYLLFVSFGNKITLWDIHSFNLLRLVSKNSWRMFVENIELKNYSGK